jgi:NADH-quinone oxidoreductase E subunit
MSRRLHPAVAGAQPFQLAERDPDAPLFDSEEGRERLEAILSRYPTKRAALLPLLGYAQELHGWISTADMEEIAEVLELTPAYIWSVASFYTMYNKHPAGRHMIQVCTNISCHLNGAPRVLEEFLAQTGTVEGETTEDGRFTVLEAECLGACGFATAVQINDAYHENVTPEKVAEILASLDGPRVG